MTSAASAAGLTVFHGEALARYGFPEPHPFACNRLGAFWVEFSRRALAQQVRVAPLVSCSEEDLLAFHTREHVQRVKRLSSEGRGFLDAGDTPGCRLRLEACRGLGRSLAERLPQPSRRQADLVEAHVAGLHRAPDSCSEEDGAP